MPHATGNPAGDAAESDTTIRTRCGDSGRRWAEEFVQIHGGDVALLTGWFANAIEAACDVRAEKFLAARSKPAGLDSGIALDLTAKSATGPASLMSAAWDSAMADAAAAQTRDDELMIGALRGEPFWGAGKPHAPPPHIESRIRAIAGGPGRSVAYISERDFWAACGRLGARVSKADGVESFNLNGVRVEHRPGIATGEIVWSGSAGVPVEPGDHPAIPDRAPRVTRGADGWTRHPQPPPLSCTGHFRVYFNRAGAAPLMWCIAPDDGAWEVAVRSVTITEPVTTVYAPKATPDHEDGKPSAWIAVEGRLTIRGDGIATIGPL